MQTANKQGCCCNAFHAHAAALYIGIRSSPRRQNRSEGLMGRCFTLTYAAWQALAAETCSTAHVSMMRGIGPHQHLPSLRSAWQVYVKHSCCLGRVIIVEAVLVSHAHSHLLSSCLHAE